MTGRGFDLSWASGKAPGGVGVGGVVRTESYTVTVREVG